MQRHQTALGRARRARSSCVPGTVYLGYNSAEYISPRAGIPAGSPAALEGLRTGSVRISTAATGSDRHPFVGEDVSAVITDGYLVEQTGDASVEEFIAHYQQAFADSGLMAVATVDHAMGAASIGEQLRPTRVTFVGSPKAGTPLLQASQTIGIDLPVRYLAWQDAAGAVHVAHPDIRALAQRHALTGVDENLAMIEKATAMFTGTAAGATG